MKTRFGIKLLFTNGDSIAGYAKNRHAAEQVLETYKYKASTLETIVLLDKYDNEMVFRANFVYGALLLGPEIFED